MQAHKTQLAISVRYACLLIGQQWRIDHAHLYKMPQDPQRLREHMPRKVATTSRTSSDQPQCSNTTEAGHIVDGDTATAQADYAGLDKRVLAHREV